MYCNQCGKQNSDDARFCQYCGCDFAKAAGSSQGGTGRRVRRSRTEQVEENPDSFKKIDAADYSGSEKKYRNKHGKKKNRAGLIALLVFLLLLSGLGVFAYFNFNLLKYRFFPEKISILSDFADGKYDPAWSENRRPVTRNNGEGFYSALAEEKDELFMDYLVHTAGKDSEAVRKSFDAYSKADSYYDRYPFLFGYPNDENMIADEDLEWYRNFINALDLKYEYHDAGILYYLSSMNKKGKLEKGLCMYALLESGYMLDTGNLDLYDSSDQKINTLSGLREGEELTFKLKYRDVYSESRVFLQNGLLSRNANDNQRNFELYGIEDSAETFTKNLNRVLDSIQDYEDILKKLGVNLINSRMSIHYYSNMNKAKEKAGVWKSEDGSLFLVVDEDGGLFSRIDDDRFYGESNRKREGTVFDYYSYVEANKLTISKGPLSGEYLRSSLSEMDAQASASATEEKNDEEQETASEPKINNPDYVEGMTSSNRKNLKEIQIYANEGVTYIYDYNKNTDLPMEFGKGQIGYLQLKKKQEIRIRNAASSSGKIVGHCYEYAALPYFDKKVSGSYTWYQIDKDYDYWIADNGTWLVFYDYE